MTREEGGENVVLTRVDTPHWGTNPFLALKARISPDDEITKSDLS